MDNDYPKDFLGNEIKLGGKCVYILGGYREFKTAYIRDITAQTVLVGTNKDTAKTLCSRRAHDAVLMIEDKDGGS